jgi:hypothetical protein
MIRHRPPNEVLEDLRYALQVLNEDDHLGLDDKYAETLRRTLFRRIAAVEAQIARESGNIAQPISSEFELTE